MRPGTRTLIIAAAAALLFSGCAGVDWRIRQRQAAFNALPERQKLLVRSNQIEEGMNQDAVFLAWGKPDEVRHGGKGTQPFEAWIYLAPTTTVENVYAMPERVLYHGRYLPEAVDYSPGFVTRWYPAKRAIFEGGRVTGWEEAAPP